MKISHFDEQNNHVRNYEVWATKEAVKKHFNDTMENPSNYQLKKFAHEMYESRLRATEGNPAESAVFVSSSNKVHGNPSMWPRTIMDPEMKV